MYQVTAVLVTLHQEFQGTEEMILVFSLFLPHSFPAPKVFGASSIQLLSHNKDGQWMI